MASSKFAGNAHQDGLVTHLVLLIAVLLFHAEEGSQIEAIKESFCQFSGHSYRKWGELESSVHIDNNYDV